MRETLSILKLETPPSLTLSLYFKYSYTTTTTTTMMSEREREALCVRAWKRRAKGRPMRWRILRDMVAVLSLGWMSTFQVQIAMRRLYALKNKTTRDILEELESEKSIIRLRDPRDEVFKWGITKEGVAFWIGKTENIPAGIVEVAAISASVRE